MKTKRKSPTNIQDTRNEQIRLDYFSTQRVRAGRPVDGKAKEGMTVAEIAKKYNISRARVYAIVGRQKGGSKMSGKKRYTATLPTASIEQQKLDQLNTLAVARGTSLASLVREAVTEYLTRNSANTTNPPNPTAS